MIYVIKDDDINCYESETGSSHFVIILITISLVIVKNVINKS